MQSQEETNRFPGNWEWIGIAFEGERVVIARVGSGQPKPRVVDLRCGSCDSSPLARLKFFRETMGQKVVSKLFSVVVLEESDHELLTLEEQELKNADEQARQKALRWAIQPLVSFPVEKASLDILIQSGVMGRRQVTLAVASEKKISPWIHSSDALKISLRAIDIKESAQRNLAHLLEQDRQSVAFLNILEDRALLTISSDGELLMTRRIEVGNLEIDHVRDRLGLEVQRTLDNFERQGGFSKASELFVGGCKNTRELSSHLSDVLGIRVSPLDEGKLLEMFEIGEKVTVLPENWGHLEMLAIGAACRGAIQ